MDLPPEEKELMTGSGALPPGERAKRIYSKFYMQIIIFFF